MTPLEKLRLAVATAHSIPGAQLVLHTRNAATIEVGDHDEATIGVCAMRRVVLACACPNQPDLAARIAQISFGGSLRSATAGIHTTSSRGQAQRVFPTFLTSTRVSALLDGAENTGPMVEGVPSDAIHAVLKPDHRLGVSVVIVSSSDPVYEDRLDDVAIEIAGLCFAEELLSTVRGGAASERTPNTQEKS